MKRRVDLMPNRRVGKRQVTVIVDEALFVRLDRYCKRMAHKKSSLIARIIRDHLTTWDVFGTSVQR